MLEDLPSDLLLLLVRRDLIAAVSMLEVSHTLHDHVLHALNLIETLEVDARDFTPTKAEAVARLPSLQKVRLLLSERDISAYAYMDPKGELVRNDSTTQVVVCVRTAMLRDADWLNFQIAKPEQQHDPQIGLQPFVDESGELSDHARLFHLPHNLMLLAGPFLRHNRHLHHVAIGRSKIDLIQMRKLTGYEHCDPHAGTRWSEFVFRAGTAFGEHPDHPENDGVACLVASACGSSDLAGFVMSNLIRIKIDLTGLHRVTGCALAECEQRAGCRVVFMSDQQQQAGPPLMLEALSPASEASLELRRLRRKQFTSANGLRKREEWNKRSDAEVWDHATPPFLLSLFVVLFAAMSLMRIFENKWALENGAKKGALISTELNGESLHGGRLGDLDRLLGDRMKQFHHEQQQQRRQQHRLESRPDRAHFDAGAAAEPEVVAD